MLFCVYFKNFVCRVLDIFFPKCCLFCNDELSVSDIGRNGDCVECDFLCKSCQNEILLIDQKNCCKRCGYPFYGSMLLKDNVYFKTNFLNKTNTTCPSCLSGKCYFNIARSCFQYKTKLRRLLMNFKFFFQTEAVDLIGSSMLNCYLTMQKADIICCIPVTRTKLFLKGYNHASLMASSFYKNLKKTTKDNNVVLLLDLLLKTSESKQSKQLLYKERMTKQYNFTVNNKYLSTKWRQFFEKKTILIVDDIMTTGATLNFGSLVLKQAFPSVKVNCLTFARTMLY